MTKSDDTIYLLNDGGSLQKIPRRHYENEALLQSLIEQNPEILAGDQMISEGPAKFILIKREAGIPDGDGSCDRWAVDHLLLDQNGIPTLVEVKRSSDTRIRREVVGQLLEYAANIDLYWSSGQIQALAVEQYGGKDELDQAIVNLLCLDPEDDVTVRLNDYWKLVEENQRNGNLRLLFVADELPSEVRCIIEFLNSKMRDVQVLGVELRQYVGDGIRAMVPRIIGQTETTRRLKDQTGPKKYTNKNELLSACPGSVQPYINELIEEATKRDMIIYWGTKGLSVRVRTRDGAPHSILYCFPPGAHQSPTAFLEVFLEEIIRGTSIASELSNCLMEIPEIRRKGQYTFRLPLTPETLPSATQIKEKVWQLAENIQDLPG